MNSIQQYIKDFFSRAGLYVLLSTVLSRGLSFLGSWLALKLLDNKELGVILFAFSIIQFIIPIGGFGLHQSLLRFGAIANTQAEKEFLLGYVLQKGVLASLVIILMVMGVGYFIPFRFTNTYFYLSILSGSILSFFLLEIVKVQFRLLHQNKQFALVEVGYHITLAVFILVFCWVAQELGYVIAMVCAPLPIAFYGLLKLPVNLGRKKEINIKLRSFWRYGFFGGLSNVATQFLLLVDLLLVGYLLDNATAVTHYRYVSIIPLSLLFLPRVFVATDFVAFTEKIQDKNYISQYIKNYLILFTFISIVLLVVGFFFSAAILSVFGAEFSVYSQSFFILIIGVTGIYIFRGLFSNLLSALGKVELNYYSILLAIIGNFISNYYLIPAYGIEGAAITSAILMWFTGLLSCGCFFYFYKKQF